MPIPAAPIAAYPVVLGGKAGPTGPAGGPTGPTGPAGSGGGGGSGTAGPTGPTGAQGTAGTSGGAGPTGPAGAQGTAGTSGGAGPTGPAGAQGTAGTPGTPGSIGPTGATGAQGTAGTSGGVGPTGPTGTQGAAGTSGGAGPTGSTGAQGTAGTSGGAGATGPAGVVSATAPLTYNSGTQNISIDLSAYAPLASPTFTGDPKAPTPTAGDNDTSIATTAFVQTGLANKVAKAGDTMTGNLTLTYATPAITLNSTGNGAINTIAGQRNGSNRWIFKLGDSTAESGSNAGSNLALSGYNDDGTTTWSVLNVTRSSKKITLAQATDVSGHLSVLPGSEYRINNSTMISSDGTNNNFSDAGGGVCLQLSTSGTINYISNTHAFYNKAVNVLYMIIGASGIYPQTDNAIYCGLTGNRWFAVYSANGLFTTSDSRIKSDHQPPNVLDRTLKLNVTSFNHFDKSTMRGGRIELGDSKQRSIGVSAQQTRQLFPEFAGTMVHGKDSTDILGINESKIGLLTLAAFQEYVRKTDARIAALEAQLKGTP